MEKILIGIEREKFNYLYKYNSCTVDIRSVVEADYDKISDSKNQSDALIRQLENSLPLYESEYEIFFIEYDKSKLVFDEGGVSLKFNGVLKIVPLNEESRDLVQSRVNKDFLLTKEIPIPLYDRIQLLRQEKIRLSTTQKLIKLFNIPEPISRSELLVKTKEYVGEILLNKDYSKVTTPLFKLLTFDTTPSFIPEGNVESFLKLGCVALQALGHDASILQKGPYYKVCYENKDKLNVLDLADSYLLLDKISKGLTEDDKIKINKLKDVLNSDFKGIDAFLIYYIYLSLNRKMVKSDFDITAIESDMKKLKETFPLELYYALFIFGYVHSFGRLYESLHRLEKAPLFKAKVEVRKYKERNFIVKKPSVVVENNKSIDIKEGQNDKIDVDKKFEEKIKFAKKYDDSKNIEVTELPFRKEQKIDFPQEPKISSSEKKEDIDVRKILVNIEKQVKASDQKTWIEFKNLFILEPVLSINKINEVFSDSSFKTKSGQLNARAKRILKIIEEEMFPSNN